MSDSDQHVVHLDQLGFGNHVDADLRPVASQQSAARVAPAVTSPVLIREAAPTNILDAAKSRLLEVRKRLLEFHGLEAEEAMLVRMIDAAEQHTH